MKTCPTCNQVLPLPVNMKPCSQCKQVLPFDAFQKQCTAKYSLRPECRACSSKNNRDRYRLASNTRKAYLQIYGAIWRKANREKISAYYKDKPEKHKTQSAAWKKENPDKVVEHLKTFRAKLPDSYIARLIALSSPAKITREQISQEFIEAKRRHLKVNRLIKEKRQ